MSKQIHYSTRMTHIVSTISTLLLLTQVGQQLQFSNFTIETANHQYTYNYIHRAVAGVWNVQKAFQVHSFQLRHSVQ